MKNVSNKRYRERERDRERDRERIKINSLFLIIYFFAKILLFMR